MPSTTEFLPVVGDRVVLRRLAPADLADFQRYRHDPDVGRYQGWKPWPDAEAAAFIEAMRIAAPFQRGQWLQIAIADRDTGRLVGDIGICLAEDGTQAELGFSLDRERQGRGLATEAVRLAIALLFARTGVVRVIGVTDARNLASIRVLERVGMRRLQSFDATFRGEPCVEHLYGVTRRLSAGPGKDGHRSS